METYVALLLDTNKTTNLVSASQAHRSQVRSALPSPPPSPRPAPRGLTHPSLPHR